MNATLPDGRVVTVAPWDETGHEAGALRMIERAAAAGLLVLVHEIDVETGQPEAVLCAQLSPGLVPIARLLREGEIANLRLVLADGTLGERASPLSRAPVVDTEPPKS